LESDHGFCPWSATVSREGATLRLPVESGMRTGIRKILIVDDNIEFARTVAQNLEKEGFLVSIAMDGNTAMQKALSESPELVLLDLKLPDIPGTEVLKGIKALNEEIAIIIITAYGGEQVAVDLMKAGAFDFLSKPFNFEDLLNAVKNALKMRDAQAEADQFERYPPLEKFFPFLAHEIRNPLHAIGGALAIIQKRSDLKDELLNQSIKVIQEEVHHLNEFVQECLDFVRPPSKSRLVEVDINELVSFIVNTMPHMFGELFGKMKVATELAPTLPKIRGNYEEIKQAFLNIVRNGFEAMDETGELIIKTCFKSHPDSGWVQIVFTDDGSGIKDENLQFLFHPFFTTKPRGTGLGLAICRRVIVERHNGRIHIKSVEGRGTTVTVELPITLPKDMA
jgi:signal transduction histidine kinase